jgi:hypothetical protein
MAEDFPYDCEDLEWERDYSDEEDEGADYSDKEDEGADWEAREGEELENRKPVEKLAKTKEIGGGYAEVSGKLKKSVKRRLRKQKLKAHLEKAGGPKPVKNLGRRRRKEKEKRAHREEHGWQALSRVRKKISTVALAERLDFSMSSGLVKDTQLGGYRPRVKKMEGEVKKIAERMKSACEGASGNPSEEILEDLRGRGYRIVAWNGE